MEETVLKPEVQKSIWKTTSNYRKIIDECIY